MPAGVARPARVNLGELRTLADRAFSRAAGAPLVAGNRVRLLFDARENYPAWEAAIRQARTAIHVEMYIVHRDRTGRAFLDLLAAKAREGVAVRFVYDWFGCGSAPALGLFDQLVAAGGDVRAFNPPAVASLLGWVRRNHRKLIVVDRRVAFVSGLCVGDEWAGDAARGVDPWRDTGLEIAGPAVAELEAGFRESWRLCGGEVDETDSRWPAVDQIPAAGDVDLRVIATAPFTASAMRVDLLVAALARTRLWITDAYFLGQGPYVEALRRAAEDGVDVRLLLPQGSDVGWVVAASRTLYRALLESGVRVFEWNGAMIHAKTAAADARWARVGSTNLNVASWLDNWELDVALEHAGLAAALEAQYEADLGRATEIVLGGRRARPRTPRPRLAGARSRRSTRRVMREVTGLGRSIGAAVTGGRPLDEFEFAPLFAFGLVLVALGLAVVELPRLFAWPVAVLAAWTGVSFLIQAVNLWRHRSRSE